MVQLGHRQIIVQIGANKGNTDNDPVFAYLNQQRASADEYTCVFVEPNPGAYERLANVYDFVRDKHIILAAISDEPGVRFLFEDNCARGTNISQHASLYRDQVLAMGHSEEVISKHTVPCLTLSSILSDLNLPYVSWLQMDTEGHDAVILRTLDRIDLPIETIQFEFIHFNRSAKSGDELSQIVSRFVERGYKVFRHKEDILLTRAEEKIQAYLAAPAVKSGSATRSKTRLACDQAIRKFSAELRTMNAGGRMLYVGIAGDPPGGEYSPFFPGHRVTTFDADAKWKPEVVGDICSTEFADSTWDLVVCVQVIEHVKQIWELPKELRRITKDNGYVIIDCPWMYPYHAEPPSFGDYWRISSDGFKALFDQYFTVISLVVDDYNTSCLLAAKPI